MTFLDRITVIILTRDEAPNIGRTLAALTGLSRIIVLDSGSSDATHEIVAERAGATVMVRPFDTHAAQWNHVLAAAQGERPWVLALDADYVLTPELVDEMRRLAPGDEISGYRVRFRYCIGGRPLSGSLYPPHVVLFRAGRSRFVQDGHTQRVEVDGAVADLKGLIHHDDRKPLSRWLSSQLNYTRLEAAHLLAKPRDQRRFADRIRLLAFPAPFVVFAYTLIFKGCLLDGWPGWFYALQRMTVEAMISLHLIEHRMSSRKKS